LRRSVIVVPLSLRVVAVVHTGQRVGVVVVPLRLWRRCAMAVAPRQPQCEPLETYRAVGRLREK
jgi:hypothetical protein